MPTAAEIIAQFGTPNIVATVDFEAELLNLRNNLVSLFPSVASYIDLETEPVQMLMQAFAYKEIILRSRINDAARQSNSIWFATGNTLDYHAAFYDVARLVGEDDDRLRERIRLAILGRSTGGTAHRYRLVAMTASLQVADAYVWRDDLTPNVRVAIRSTDVGGVASPALLATVTTALNQADVRMVNDTIVVTGAVTTTVTIAARIWLLPTAPDTLLTTLPQTLRDLWDVQSGLGFNLTTAWLISRLMQPGVQRIELTSPLTDTIVQPSSALAIGTVTLTYMGRDI
jgi:phage-related baseplate assembly protein